MNTTMEGFTLIELISVVGIIGIIATLSFPYYNNYIARTQVTEALNIASEYKLKLSTYYATKGAWPTDLTNISGQTSGSFVDNVSLNIVGTNAGIVVTMRFSGVNLKIAGGTFVLASNNGGNWDCDRFTGNAAVHGMDIETQYLPFVCIP